MDIKGKILVFPKEVGTTKKIKIFETSISRKDGEKYVDNYTMRVDFSKDVLPEEKKAAFKVDYVYSMEVEGFLTTRKYETKNGVRIIDPVVKVTKAKSLDKGRPVQKKQQAEAAPANEAEPLETDPDALPF